MFMRCIGLSAFSCYPVPQVFKFLVHCSFGGSPFCSSPNSSVPDAKVWNLTSELPFSPIMGAWTITTPLVGIYSIVQHYPSIFKALSPHYIFHFFWRRGKDGWLLLGGTVLCITGKSCFYPVTCCLV